MGHSRVKRVYGGVKLQPLDLDFTYDLEFGEYSRIQQAPWVNYSVDPQSLDCG